MFLAFRFAARRPPPRPRELAPVLGPAVVPVCPRHDRVDGHRPSWWSAALLFRPSSTPSTVFASLRSHGGSLRRGDGVNKTCVMMASSSFPAKNHTTNVRRLGSPRPAPPSPRLGPIRKQEREGVRVRTNRMAGRGEHMEGIFHLDRWGGKEGGWRVQKQTTHSHPSSHPPRITQLRFHTHTDTGSCTLWHT